jgi:hypothetical protein
MRDKAHSSSLSPVDVISRSQPFGGTVMHVAFSPHPPRTPRPFPHHRHRHHQSRRSHNQTLRSRTLSLQHSLATRLVVLLLLIYIACHRIRYVHNLTMVRRQHKVSPGVMLLVVDPVPSCSSNVLQMSSVPSTMKQSVCIKFSTNHRRAARRSRGSPLCGCHLVSSRPRCSCGLGRSSCRSW